MFYEFEYDVTIYDVPMATMLQSQCYHRNVTVYEVVFDVTILPRVLY